MFKKIYMATRNFRIWEPAVLRDFKIWKSHIHGNAWLVEKGNKKNDIFWVLFFPLAKLSLSLSLSLYLYLYLSI